MCPGLSIVITSLLNYGVAYVQGRSGRLSVAQYLQGYRDTAGLSHLSITSDVILCKECCDWVRDLIDLEQSNYCTFIPKVNRET